MDLPNVKALKKLADACRKAGIVHFKSPDFEFTLADLPPPTLKKASREFAKVDLGENKVESDDPDPESVLFWSVGSDTALL